MPDRPCAGAHATIVVSPPARCVIEHAHTRNRIDRLSRAQRGASSALPIARVLRPSNVFSGARACTVASHDPGRRIVEFAPKAVDVGHDDVCIDTDCARDRSGHLIGIDIVRVRTIPGDRHGTRFVTRKPSLTAGWTRAISPTNTIDAPPIGATARATRRRPSWPLTPAARVRLKRAHEFFVDGKQTKCSVTTSVAAPVTIGYARADDVTLGERGIDSRAASMLDDDPGARSDGRGDIAEKRIGRAWSSRRAPPCLRLVNTGAFVSTLGTAPAHAGAARARHAKTRTI